MNTINDIIDIRSKKKQLKGDVVFQLFEFYEEDDTITNYCSDYHEYITEKIQDRLGVAEDEDDVEVEHKKFLKEKVYSIKMFGVLENGETITVHVNDFEPFFYIRLPEEFYLNDNGTVNNKLLIKNCKIFRKNILNAIYKNLKAKFKEQNKIFRKEKHYTPFTVSHTESKTLYWFDNEKNHIFMKLTFPCIGEYYNVRNLFMSRDSTQIPFNWNGKENLKFDLYEANIDAMLKFFHIRNIKPSGWIKLKNRYYSNITKRKTTTNYEIVISYKNIHPYEKDTTAPYVISSFDIECDSLHGDFPLAKKDYKKYSKIILEKYHHHQLENPDSDFGIIIAKVISTFLGNKMFYDDIDVVKMKPGHREVTSSVITMVTGRVKNILEMDDKDWNEKEMDITSIFNRSFPNLEGDPIIQIGTTFRIGNYNKIGGIIYTLNTCDEIPNPTGGSENNIIVRAVDDEKTLISEWFNMIRQTDPDIITGYNINGFDYEYILRRMIELKMIENDKSIYYPGLSRANHINQRETYRYGSRYKCVNISSAAMGDNENKFLTTFGRINMDFLKVVRKTYMSLESYKLDSIAATFMNGSIVNTERINNEDETQNNVKCYVKKKEFSQFVKGDYITFSDGGLWFSGKVQILDVIDDAENPYIIVNYPIPKEGDKDDIEKIKVWKKAKDDVPPQEIFRLQKGSSADRAKVAKYCIQDCNLVLDLDTKIENIQKAIAMANVCSVPLGFIFLRGQGIKLASLVFKECSKKNVLIKTLERNTSFGGRIINGYREVDGYEGAVVLEPKTGIYLDEPVAVLDYSSLYPSSMISENISHDSLVWIRDYDLEGNEIPDSLQGNPEYDNLDGYNYINIEYDIQGYSQDDLRKNPEKSKIGTRVCRYAQKVDQSKSIIPSILRNLLGERKKRKKWMKTETDPFKKGLLDAEQLAFKVTANSLYGQTGAKTSKFCFIPIAACTTSFGRKLLNYAKHGLEEIYCRDNDNRCNATYIYGDTDSVFVSFRPNGPDGKLLKGRDALQKSIELAEEAEVILSAVLKEPHFLEYEKTFMPFILLSKKRYIGNKYEKDLDKYKRTNMGVVTKRRDNAPIVKVAYNRMNDVLMNEKSVPKTVYAIQKIMQDMIDGKYGLEYLTITKSLKAHYKDPLAVAHKVLADRIGERDPGNKPKPNDRLGFVYIEVPTTPGKKILQGNRIETPEYIRENNLKPDYEFYITNQIMKPILQVLAINVEEIPGYRKPIGHWRRLESNLRCTQASKYNNKKLKEHIDKLKQKEVETLVFNKYIRRAQNKKEGPLDKLFSKKVKNKNL
jgi:DNA polymerase elongation subunit (family B)